MKMNTEPTFVHTDGVGEVKRATIKASSKIFDFFSKQIYSDAYTAIWRELVANGIDAQRIRGETRPPVVTLPSMLEPMAKVRDFGTGMGHEFMMNKFMAFTDASTKENSDEFIGGFGIGSKAPLSYTDQYSIKCYQNGQVRVYSVFKDEEGCPSIAFLAVEPTTEPDGVEVAFPVRQDDIEKFTSTVCRTLQYFEPLPILDNTDLKLEPVNYDAKGSKWGIRVTGPDRLSKVIIGGVSYPLDVSQVPYDHMTLRNHAGLGLDLYLDIGDANIALSREHITHDKALFEKLTAIVNTIGEEFGKQMSKKFDGCKTLWEAKLMFAKALTDVDYATGNLLRKNAFWQGDKIDTFIKRPEKVEVLIIAKGDFGWNRDMSGIVTTQAISPKFRTWESHAYFTPTAFDLIVIEDTDDKPMLRLRTLFEKHKDKKILVLRDNSEKKDQDMKKVLAGMGGPPAAMIDYVSKHDPMKVTRSASGSGVARSFKCYVRDGSPYRGMGGASNTLPAGGGLYVVMDNFMSKSATRDVEIAQKAKPKNTVWLNLTDFKASGIDQMKDWFTVDEGIAKVKADYKSKHKRLPLAEAYYRWAPRQGLPTYIEELSKHSNFPKRGPLAEILRLHNEFEPVSDRAHSDIRCNLLDIKWEAEHKKLLDLIAKARSKHPHIVEITRDSYLLRKMSPSLINALFTK